MPKNKLVFDFIFVPKGDKDVKRSIRATAETVEELRGKISNISKEFANISGSARKFLKQTGEDLGKLKGMAAETFSGVGATFSGAEGKGKRSLEFKGQTSGEKSAAVEQKLASGRAKFSAEIDKLIIASNRSVRKRREIQRRADLRLNAIQRRAAQKSIADRLTKFRKIRAILIRNANRAIANATRAALNQSSIQQEETKKLNQVIKEQLEASLKEVDQNFAEAAGSIDQWSEKINENASQLLKDAQALSKSDVGRKEAEAKGRAERPGVLSQLAFGGGGFENIKSLVGTGGFSVLQFGDQLQNLIKGGKLQGQLVGAFSEVGSIIGRILPGIFAEIFTDIAKVVGEIAELTANLFILPFKLAGAIVAGLIKGLGKLALATAFASMKPAFASIFGIITGGFLLVSEIVTNVMSVLMDALVNIISTGLKIIFDIFKIGLKLIVSVVQAFGKILKTVWTGIWKGLKGVVEATVQTVKVLVEQLKSFVGVAFKEFIALEFAAARSLSQVADALDKPQNSLEKFAGVIGDLVSAFGFDLQNASSAVFDIFSSGFTDVAEVAKLAENAAMLAISSPTDAGLDLAASVDAIITAFTAYKSAGETITSVTRVLSAATTQARSNIADFGPAFKLVGSTASAAQVPIRDLTTAIAIMTRAFGKGSAKSSARFLNRVIESLSISGGKARKNLKAMGIEVNANTNFLEGFVDIIKQLKNVEITDIGEFFTTIQARRGFIALQKEIDTFEDIRKRGKDLEDAFEEAFGTVFKTTQVQLQRISGSIKIFFAKIGKIIIAPLRAPLRQLADMFTAIVKLFSENSAAVRGFADAFMNFAGPIVDMVLKPIFDILGGITDRIKSLLTGGNFNKIFESPALVKALDLITMIIQNVAQIPLSFEKAFAVVDKIKIGFGFIAELSEKLVNIMANFGGDIQVELLLRTFNALVMAANIIKSAFKEATGNFSLILVILRKAIAELVSGPLLTFGKAFGNVLLEVIKFAADSFLVLFGATFADIGLALSSTLLDSIREALLAFAEEQPELAKKFDIAANIADVANKVPSPLMLPGIGNLWKKLLGNVARIIETPQREAGKAAGSLQRIQDTLENKALQIKSKTDQELADSIDKSQKKLRNTLREQTIEFAKGFKETTDILKETLNSLQTDAFDETSKNTKRLLNVTEGILKLFGDLVAEPPPPGLDKPVKLAKMSESEFRDFQVERKREKAEENIASIEEQIQNKKDELRKARETGDAEAVARIARELLNLRRQLREQKEFLEELPPPKKRDEGKAEPKKIPTNINQELNKQIIERKRLESEVEDKARQSAEAKKELAEDPEDKLLRQRATDLALELIRSQRELEEAKKREADLRRQKSEEESRKREEKNELPEVPSVEPNKDPANNVGFERSDNFSELIGIMKDIDDKLGSPLKVDVETLPPVPVDVHEFM